MLCTFLYQIAVSLLLIILSTQAESYVTVPDVYTAIQADTIIKCYIMFMENELLTSEKITFELVGTNLRCDITKWHLCPPVYLSEDHRPGNFSCGCLMHATAHNFIFYLYLQSCPKELHNSRYRCSLASAKDIHSDGQLRLIDFSKKPDREILKCEGDKVDFRWEYNPDDFESQLKVSYITWSFYPDGGEPVHIATFEHGVLHDQDTVHFGNRASFYIVPLKKTIPFLEVESLNEGDVGTFQIEIIFLSHDDTERNIDEEVASSLNETLSTPANLKKEDELEENFTDRRRIQRGLTKNGLRDHHGLWEHADEANDSSPRTLLLADYIEKIKPTLRSSVTLRLIEPLREHLSIVFKKMRRSGDLFLYCSVLSHSSHTSFEHLGFVLKHGDTVLNITRNQSFLLMKLDPESTMDNYLCELTGESLRCSNTGSRNKLIPSMQIENMLSDEIVLDGIDTTFTLVDVLFVLEGVVCGFLMIWNCTLMGKHLRLACSRKANREKNKLKRVITTSYLNRMTALEQTRQKMQFTTFFATTSPATSVMVSELTSTPMLSSNASPFDPTLDFTDEASPLSVTPGGSTPLASGGSPTSWQNETFNN